MQTDASSAGHNEYKISILFGEVFTIFDFKSKSLNILQRDHYTTVYITACQCLSHWDLYFITYIRQFSFIILIFNWIITFLTFFIYKPIKLSSSLNIKKVTKIYISFIII